MSFLPWCAYPDHTTTTTTNVIDRQTKRTCAIQRLSAQHLVANNPLRIGQPGLLVVAQLNGGGAHLETPADWMLTVVGCCCWARWRCGRRMNGDGCVVVLALLMQLIELTVVIDAVAAAVASGRRFAGRWHGTHGGCVRDCDGGAELRWCGRTVTTRVRSDDELG